MFVDRHGQGNRGVLENENKGRLEKFKFGGKTTMHESTLFLDFIKRCSRPPSGGSFTANGILLCYANSNANANAMLVCYLGKCRL